MYNYNMLRITEVSVEHRKTPLGIDCSTPRFAWKLKSDVNNTWQKAYRIRIMDEQSSLAADTGVIKSDQSIEVTVPEFCPSAKTRYEVRVQVWDNHGRTESFASWFETGKMGEPFQSPWCQPVQEPTPDTMDIAREHDGLGDDAVRRDACGNRTYEEFRPVQYIQIPFSIDKPVKKARVYASARGIYHLEVNGKAPDNRLFAPEITAYQKLMYYQTYDVTELLEGGDNVIGLTLADGWWTGRVGTTGDCCQYGDKTSYILDVEITFMDGSCLTVTGDQGYSCTGALIFADLFVGEKYDARKELQDMTCLQKVEQIDETKEVLQAQPHSPVEPLMEWTPKEIFNAPNGDTILDAGQVLAGFTEISLTAPAGCEIRLEHFEVLDENGNYFNSILNANKEQTDIYITKEGYQTWRPRFTYHGFRYVRITGWPGNPSVLNFKIVAVSSAMEQTGSFETSDPRLNQLQKNIWWSQVSNTIAIPTDCPQREKAGWTGDIMAFAPTLCFNRDADAFLSSWMNSVRAEQLPDGAVPMIVPYLKAYRTFIKGNLGTDTSCGWGDAVIIVPYVLYKYYGDMRVLRENYDAMKAWMEYVRGRAENHHPKGFDAWDQERRERSRYLWNTDFHFGDWLIPSIVLGNPDAMAMNETAYATMGIVAPAYYAFSAKNISEIAQILGKDEDAEYYSNLYGKIREAFIVEYIHEDGTMDADFQGIYVIALQMGLFTDELRPKMVSHLCKLIRENGDCLDTGFLSVLFLLDVLCDNGCSDVAYRLLYQTKCPSWLYEIKKGATTMWESWGAVSPGGTVSTYSYNHYAFGCVGDFMYRHIGGLSALEPGWKKFRVSPDIRECGLTGASVSEETPYGEAAVSWSLLNDRVHMRVEVPVNTQAVIALPGMEERIVSNGTVLFDTFLPDAPERSTK